MKERKRYIHKWEERILNFITLGGSGIFIMLATLQVFIFFYFSLFGERVQADVHTDKEKIYLLYQVDGQHYESDVTEIVFHPKETEVIWYLEKNPKEIFVVDQLQVALYWYAGCVVILIIRYLFLVILRRMPSTANGWYGKHISCGKEWSLITFGKDKEREIR